MLAEMMGAKMRLRLETFDAELSAVAVALRDVVRKAAAEEPAARFQRASHMLEAVSNATASPGSDWATDADEVRQDNQLSDEDVVVLATIAGLCPMPGDATSYHFINEAISGMPDYALSTCLKRLLRLGFIAHEHNEEYGIEHRVDISRHRSV